MKKILIAKITTVFGVKGEVKMVIYSNEPENIEKYQLSDEEGGNFKVKLKNQTIIGHSSGDPIMIAKIDGINDRNSAELLRGKELFVNREDLKETNEDEFYYSDLIGLEVIDSNSNKIAKVKNVFDFGAGGVIEIEFYNNKKIENFPFKNEIFPEVNLEEGFIRIDIPELV